MALWKHKPDIIALDRVLVFTVWVTAASPSTPVITSQEACESKFPAYQLNYTVNLARLHNKTPRTENVNILMVSGLHHNTLLLIHTSICICTWELS